MRGSISSGNVVSFATSVALLLSSSYNDNMPPSLREYGKSLLFVYKKAPQVTFKSTCCIPQPLCGRDMSVSTCSTPAHARHTMARLSLVLLAPWPVIAALCSLLSSLLLDAAEECAGHGFPRPGCSGSCQRKSLLTFVCGCRTATPAATACSTGLRFH